MQDGLISKVRGHCLALAYAFAHGLELSPLKPYLPCFGEMYQRFEIRLVFESRTKTAICRYLVAISQKGGYQLPRFQKNCELPGPVFCFFSGQISSFSERREMWDENLSANRSNLELFDEAVELPKNYNIS